MPRKTKKATKAKSGSQATQYVAVAILHSEDQAKEYQSMLAGNDIPSIIKEHNGDVENTGYDVLVPEESTDEAYVVVESSEAYEDFYDLTMEDEDEDALNDDFFDNDF